MSIVLGNCVHGKFMGACGMFIEGRDDIRVMETISIEHDGDCIHGVGHVLGVTDLIRRAAHGGNVELVMVSGDVVAEFDAEVSHGDGPVGALESAATIMNLDSTGALLIRARTTTTSFHEIGVLLSGGSSGVGHTVRERNLGEVGDVVGTRVKALSVCHLSEGIVPNAVRERGKFTPSVGSVVKAIMAGSNREIVVPNVVGGSGNGAPSVLACERLSGFIPRKFDPSVLAGESASGIIPCRKVGNGKASGGSGSRRGWLLACSCRLRGSNQRRRWRSLRIRFRHGQERKDG